MVIGLGSGAVTTIAKGANTSLPSGIGRVLGALYRRQGAWKFRAVGLGWSSGLAGLAGDYGISVDDDPAPAAAAPAAAAPRSPAAQAPPTQPPPPPSGPPVNSAPPPQAGSIN